MNSANPPSQQLEDNPQGRGRKQVSHETRHAHRRTASWGNDHVNATDPDSRHPLPPPQRGDLWSMVWRTLFKMKQAARRRGATRKVQVWIRVMPKSTVREEPTVKRQPRSLNVLLLQPIVSTGSKRESQKHEGSNQHIYWVPTNPTWLLYWLDDQLIPWSNRDEYGDCQS